MHCRLRRWVVSIFHFGWEFERRCCGKNWVCAGDNWRNKHHVTSTDELSRMVLISRGWSKPCERVHLLILGGNVGISSVVNGTNYITLIEHVTKHKVIAIITRIAKITPSILRFHEIYESRRWIRKPIVAYHGACRSILQIWSNTTSDKTTIIISWIEGAICFDVGIVNEIWGRRSVIINDIINQLNVLRSEFLEKIFTYYSISKITWFRKYTHIISVDNASNDAHMDGRKDSNGGSTIKVLPRLVIFIVEGVGGLYSGDLQIHDIDITGLWPISLQTNTN